MADRIVYFHGQPGGPAELALAGGADVAARASVEAGDRARQDPALGFAGRIAAQAQSLSGSPAPLRLIGFSLGAFVAMEVAMRLAEQAPSLPVSLELISPAAPLTLGAFLPHMAGRDVFRLARDAPAGFVAVTRFQGVAAVVAPALLVGRLFAGATGAEAALTSDPAFRCGAARMFRGALAGGARIYRQDILAYVSQDAARLSRLERPVRIWQGLDDTWTPPPMADALARALPNVTGVERLAGRSHYSTLQLALPLAIQSACSA